MINLTIKTLKDRPEFRQESLALIEKSFGYEKDQSYSVDFYSLIRKENDENRFLLLKEEKLIGHIGVKKKIFHFHNFESTFIFIGGIAIAESERGKGYFQKLMDHVLNHYKNDCALFMLWSDKSSLYEKFGFHLSIGQMQLNPSELELKEFRKIKYKQCNYEEKVQIQELYNSFIETQFFCPKRTEYSWKEIEDITSSDLYIKKYKEKIICYAFVGKGKDLANTCHEIAFAEEKMMKDYILNPLFQTWLPEIYSQQSPNSQLQYGSLVKINKNKLFRDLIDFWSDGEIIINSMTSEKIYFNFMNESFELSHQEFLTSLFGPYPFKEFQHFHKSILIPGLDSI
jgi:predicted GNAT family N-acyltransferase